MILEHSHAANPWHQEFPVLLHLRYEETLASYLPSSCWAEIPGALQNSLSCLDPDLQGVRDNCQTAAASAAEEARVTEFARLASANTSRDATESGYIALATASFATTKQSFATAGPSRPSESTMDCAHTLVRTVAADPS